MKEKIKLKYSRTTKPVDAYFVPCLCRRVTHYCVDATDNTILKCRSKFKTATLITMHVLPKLYVFNGHELKAVYTLSPHSPVSKVTEQSASFLVSIDIKYEHLNTCILLYSSILNTSTMISETPRRYHSLPD